MKFLFPQFLWALTALSIPLIIHLFNFQRPKKVFFSNVNLLENVKTRTSSIQNLKHILILITRMLFLAFLVLAFAQPFIPASDQTEGGNEMVKVFYLDNSFSMQTENQGNTLLENAVSGLESFREMIGNSEEVYFLDNDFRVKDLYPYTKENFGNRLADVQESYSRKSFDEILDRIDQIEYKGPKEIFIITDLQKSTLGDLSKVNPDTNNIYNLIVLESDEITNISIDSAWLEKPFVLENDDNNLMVRLRYSGKEEIENFPVKLFIDEKQAAASNVNLIPESNSEIVFSLPGRSLAESRGVVSIDDSPVYFDNDYYFVLRTISDLKVSVIGKEENKYLSALYRTEEFFRYNYVPISNPDYSLLSASDFIILDQIEEFPEYLRDFLKSYLEKGGHFLVIPSDKNEALPEFLTELGLYNSSEKNEVLSLEIADPDMNDPFFEGVFERFEKNTDMPYALPVITAKGFDLIHLKYRDGNAFLAEKSYANGKFFVITSLLNEEQSNFYRHSIFVPVMFKMTTSSLQGSASRLAYSFGQEAVLWEMSKTNLGESALKLKNEELEIIPDQRPVPEGVLLNLPEDDMKPGFYEVVMKDTALGTLAMNINSEESELASMDIDEFLSELPDSEWININDTNEMKAYAENYRESNFGTSLWKYFLICSILFLAAEVFLLRLL